jgi:hypothetical protein
MAEISILLKKDRYIYILILNFPIRKVVCCWYVGLCVIHYDQTRSEDVIFATKNLGF